MAVAQLTQCRIEAVLVGRFPEGLLRRELLDHFAQEMIGPRSRAGAKGRLARRLYLQLDRLARKGRVRITEGLVEAGTAPIRCETPPLLTPRLKRLLFFALLAEDRLVKVAPEGLERARAAFREAAQEAGWTPEAIHQALGLVGRESPSAQGGSGAWSVYILHCGDGTYYTGIARDVQKRLGQHQAGRGAKYTRGRGPLRLVYQEELGTRGEALRREAAIKALPRADKAALAEAFLPA